MSVARNRRVFHGAAPLQEAWVRPMLRIIQRLSDRSTHCVQGALWRGCYAALPLPNSLRVRHIDGLSRGEGKQLVDGQTVEGFIAAPLSVSKVRSAQDIRHLQQRMRRVD